MSEGDVCLKINIFFYIKDKKYRKALIEYISAKYTCFQVFDFENLDDILAYSASRDIKTDVLLTDDETIIGHAGIFNVAAILKTIEFNEQKKIDNYHDCESSANLSEENRIFYLYKYQSGDDIANKIISALDASHQTTANSSKQKNITAVMGLHGGAGKSLISAALSLAAAVKKSKSLYLNFESFHYDLFIARQEYEINYDACISNMNMTKLVYYLKDNYSSFQAKANTCILHSIKGVDFVKTASNIADVSHINSQDAENLIKWLRASEYDKIFFDLPVYVNEMTEKLFDFCDNIILVRSGHSCNEEANKIKDFINKRFEISKTLNKPNIIIVDNCADKNNHYANTNINTGIFEERIHHASVPFCSYISQRSNESDIARALENDKNFWSAINKILKMTDNNTQVF